MDNNTIDLKQKSVIELKAIAYDFGVLINEYKNMLNAVNQEIVMRAQQEQANMTPTPPEKSNSKVKTKEEIAHHRV